MTKACEINGMRYGNLYANPANPYIRLAGGNSLNQKGLADYANLAQGGGVSVVVEIGVSTAPAPTEGRA